MLRSLLISLQPFQIFNFFVYFFSQYDGERTKRGNFGVISLKSTDVRAGHGLAWYAFCHTMLVKFPANARANS